MVFGIGPIAVPGRIGIAVARRILLGFEALVRLLRIAVTHKGRHGSPALGD